MTEGDTAMVKGNTPDAGALVTILLVCDSVENLRHTEECCVVEFPNGRRRLFHKTRLVLQSKEIPF